MALSLILVLFSASFLLVRRYGLAAVYPLFLLGFTQNFIVPLLYSTGVFGAQTSTTLIVAKEILLLALFLYCVQSLCARQVRVPGPVLLLGFFVAWCAFRGGVAVLCGEDLVNAGRMVRSVAVPLGIFTAGYAAALQQDLVDRLLRWLSHVLVILALAALLLFAFAGAEFWQDYVNLATYNVEVKGEDPSDQLEDAGVSATGAGREEFLFLAQFRAMGTFGDPISLGFALALGVLLLAFHGQWRPSRFPWLVALLAALFVSFTRSAWTFVAVASATILIRRQRYGLLLAGSLGAVLLMSFFPGFADFAWSSLEKLITADPADMHAAGLRGFYTDIWRDSGNLFGKGLEPAVRAIPESGYAFLVEHFGLPAYASFVAFHVCLFASLSRVTRVPGKLAEIAQGTIVGTLVTMHASQYAFSFSGYLGIWFLLGCASGALWPPPTAMLPSQLPAAQQL